ncbi:hypothetical protein P0D69_43865 [Paraburkholderia sediminicola]|uniref:hypothetical protein n=1 Tax=Paraburkholderia sediminicola TaxID=458836 RepID=UPI0038B73583
MDENLHRYEIKPIAVNEFAGWIPWVWGLVLVANLLPPGKASTRRYIFRISVDSSDHQRFLFGGVPGFLNTLLRTVIAERESAFITLSQPIEIFDKPNFNEPAFTVDIGHIIAIEIPNSRDPHNVYSYRRYMPKVAIQPIDGERAAPIERSLGNVVNRYEIHPSAVQENPAPAQYWVIFVGRLARHPERRYVFWITDDLSKPQAPKFEGVPQVLSTHLQAVAEEKGSVYITLSDTIENLDKLVGEDSDNNSYSYTPKWIVGITEIEIPNPRDPGNVFIYRRYADKFGEESREGPNDLPQYQFHNRTNRTISLTFNYQTLNGTPTNSWTTLILSGHLYPPNGPVKYFPNNYATVVPNWGKPSWDTRNDILGEIPSGDFFIDPE